MWKGQDSILARLGKALHVGTDDIAHEPLPRRWVELIHYLDEQERKHSKRAQRDDKVGVVGSRRT
jgi:hypothetical protein